MYATKALKALKKYSIKIIDLYIGRCQTGPSLCLMQDLYTYWLGIQAMSYRVRN